MPKVILKCRYLKAGKAVHAKNLVKYIATRDGVATLDDTWKVKPASKGQRDLIAELLRDFPDAEKSYEYQDYLDEPTQGNASDFISRTIEDNLDRIGKKENYMHYIAKRPRVEKLGTHGLFVGTDSPIDLDAVANEVASHPGIVWTNILSIRREDASRLGYDRAESWKQLIRKQAPAMAKAMKIPLTDLRWQAAFHNEGHHPHCHIVAYSVGKEPYMSEKAILDLKAAFAREMFRQDRLQIYEKQTVYRDALTAEARGIMAGIVSQINEGTYQNAPLEVLLQELGKRLRNTSGKKVYGYLPQPTRNIVNAIADELAKDPQISALYNLWYEQQCQIVGFYQDTAPEKIPLSQNKVFQTVRNAIIQEAARMLEKPTVIVLTEEPLKDSTQQEEPVEAIAEDTPAVIIPTPEEVPLPASADEQQPPPEGAFPQFFRMDGRQKKDTWWNEDYQAARKLLYGAKDTPPDFSQAFPLMEEEAKLGNGFAMHDLGKMYLSGLGCGKDEEAVQRWFQAAMKAFLKMESSAKAKDYWQYRIGKLHAYGYGTPQDDTQSAAWFTRAVSENNPFAAYALGGQYYRGQGVEQDFQKAFGLFYEAATHEKKPNAYAQYQLGMMLRDGIGTEADKTQSEYWYQEAYRGFFAMEQQMADDKLYYRLGSMNLYGTGTRKDLMKAKEYFEKAAADGNQYAQYQLGKMLLFGLEIEKDIQRGMAFLQASAVQGNEYAMRLINNYGKRPMGFAMARLLAYMGSLIQNQIEEDNKQAVIIDRKLRQQIESKKQALGLKMG